MHQRFNQFVTRAVLPMHQILDQFVATQQFQHLLEVRMYAWAIG